MTHIVPSEAMEQEYPMDFQFEGKPIWVRTDVTLLEALEIFKTGLLRNQVVSKVQVFSVGDDTQVNFVYDIIAAKQGNTPWSVMI